MPTKPKAELHPAHAWDCDQCGKENFCRSVVAEFSDEERRELAEEHGLQPWEQSMLMTVPEEVTCEHCGAEYETVDFREDTERE